MEIHCDQSLAGRYPLVVKTALIVGVVIAGCFLGIALTTGVSNPTLQLASAALAAGGLLAGIGSIAFGLTYISVIRAGFLLSFFIKLDLNLFKIDEIEDPSGLNISVTLVLALALLIYDKWHDQDSGAVFTTQIWLILGALFITAVSSVLLTGFRPLGVFSVFSFSTSILIAYATASHFGRQERIKTLIIWLAVGVLFTGLVALSQHSISWPTEMPFFGTGTEEELLGTQAQSLGRVQAFLRTPTEMAWVISTLIPLIAAPVFYGVKGLVSWERWLLILSSLVGSIGIILSLARGSWIGLVVAILFLTVCAGFHRPRLERQRYLMSAAAAALLVGLVLFPFSGTIYERLTGDDQGAAAIRMPLMENALLMIEDNAVSGVGLNGYRSTMTKYDETGMFVSTVFPNPVHNIFAHITAEIGVFGGAVFILLLGYGMVSALRSCGSTNRLLAALAIGTAIGLVAFVISGVKEPGSLGSTRPPVRTCFLLLGSIMAIGRLADTHKRAPQNRWKTTP